MDFVHDWLMTNRNLKCLTIVDDFTKECVGILVDHSISGEAVGQFLGSRGVLPERMRSDNGPEFQSNALRVWAETTGITHDFITPGKPNENAFIESFNSRFRDEGLNERVSSIRSRSMPRDWTCITGWMGRRAWTANV